MNNYHFHAIDDIQIIRVGDLLSEFVVKEILSATQVKIDKGFSNFAVDLSEMQVMNSVGLNFLILLKKRASGVGGQVAIIKAPPKVLHLLVVTKLKPLFFLSDSIAEAIDCLLNAEPLEVVS